MPMTYVDRVHRALLWIGILELLASICVVACGIVNVIVKARLYHIGHGIWSGFIFAIAASSAIAIGLSKSRGYQASHIASCVVACVFTLPGLTTLIFIEKVSDTWYSFWTDPDTCRSGCYLPNGEYIHVNYGQWFAGGSGLDRLQCDSMEWRSLCHPNTVAVTMETATLAILSILSALFILSSCLTCCIICRCRANSLFSRDEVYPLSPADSIIVYTTYAVPNHHHAAYYNHGNITWAIPYNNHDLAMHNYQQQQQPNQASLNAPPPTYDETQRQIQLLQQQQQQIQQIQQVQLPQLPLSQDGEAKL